MDIPEIVRLDAIALSSAIKSKRVSCVEVMNAYLDHIDRMNPRVNAIVSMQPIVPTCSTRRRLATSNSRAANILAAMHGFPQAIKDLEPTQRNPHYLWLAAVQGLRAERRRDLRRANEAAGSIIIGKTNVPELGLGSQTYNNVFGTTLNAYDQSKTCGGSSGGAAVALALGCSRSRTAAITRGSLRNPAAFNEHLRLSALLWPRPRL